MSIIAMSEQVENRPEGLAVRGTGREEPLRRLALCLDPGRVAGRAVFVAKPDLLL